MAHMYTHILPLNSVWNLRGQGQTWFKVVTKVSKDVEVPVVDRVELKVVAEEKCKLLLCIIFVLFILIYLGYTVTDAILLIKPC